MSLCIICHQRPDELDDALASAAGQGFDEVVVLDMASDPPLDPRPGVIWLRSDENLGVTAGRNRLLAVSRADVLVFLDDDAVLLSEVRDRLCRWFVDDRLALVALGVRRKGGFVHSTEYPFRGKPSGSQQPRPCTYFVGAGYAARRSALVQVGGQDEGFFYSTEEVELGFRLIARGWHLVYDPSLRIEHRPSERGRSVAPRIPALRLRNRLIMLRRHLPAPVAVVHAMVWGARTFGEARAAGSIRPWLGAWWDGLQTPVERAPLPWATVVDVHRLGGRVLW